MKCEDKLGGIAFFLLIPDRGLSENNFLHRHKINTLKISISLTMKFHS